MLVDAGKQSNFKTHSEITVVNAQNETITLSQKQQNKFFTSRMLLNTGVSLCLGTEIKINSNYALKFEAAEFIGYNPNQKTKPIDMRFYYPSINIGLACSIN